MTELAWFLDRHLGRIFLALAAVWLLIVLLWKDPDAAGEFKLPEGDIVVEAPKSHARAVAAPFPAESVSEYTAGERFVFVAERKVVEFHPVDLDVPESGIREAPPLLPSPGPSLEGAMKLAKSSTIPSPPKTEKPKDEQPRPPAKP
ncbi:MAG: hypothetical protein N3A38_10635 [Planctomycetota bacterium]|nr:hypothetical protein [Planctomycetota bacterium]